MSEHDTEAAGFVLGKSLPADAYTHTHVRFSLSSFSNPRHALGCSCFSENYSKPFDFSR
eukprot:m.23216 g.23216  ORF g.23216 m.23216 type:complete len:59 (-) comp34812_c0_seq1:912-1088(-)